MAAILALNAGSSSIKFALFDVAGAPRRIATGAMDGIGTTPRFHARDLADGEAVQKSFPGGSHEELLGEVLAWAEHHLGGERLLAAGHRIVHGGAEFVRPVRLDEKVMTALERLIPLAPLHEPHSLSAIRAVAKLRPRLVQVGCFDTAFHSSMDATARRFALPFAMEADGIRRYGFHGLSYEFIAGRLREIAPERAGGRIIAAHLGNGASLCAMKDGRSVDTTMGFTALDGLMMGTRCGALDPGVLLYLVQQRGMDGDALEDLLYRKSGLLGVSGLTSDMRTLEASSDPRAAAAIDLFVFRIGREIGALAASLGGLDGLVFTAGIGENSALIRRLVAARAAWAGVALDEAANARGDLLLSPPDGRVAVWTIPTDEEMMIVRHTLALLV